MEEMDKRNAFWLSIANTFAVAWFASIGAFYLEVNQQIDKVNENVAGLVIVVVVVIGIVVLGLYTYIGHNIYNDDN